MEEAGSRATKLRKWLRRKVEICLSMNGEMRLEHRFLQGLCLLGAFVSFFVLLPLNSYQHLSPLVNRGVFLYGLINLGLYFASRRGLYLEKTTFILLMVVLNILWFLNGGSQGSIGMYFFLAMAFLVIFFQGWFRVLMLTLFMLNGFALFLVEGWFPQFVIPFASPADRYLDLLTGFLVSNLVGALMLWVVVVGYRQERARLKASMEALATAERRHQALLSHSWDILSIIDAQGTLRYNSPAVRRIHGFEDTELLGRDSFVQVHPEDRPRAMGVFQTALGSPGIPVQTQFRYARKDGTWVEMEVVGVSHLDDPSIRGVVTNSRDITERVKAERQLQESEALLSALLNSTDDLVLLVDTDRFALKLCNQAAREHFKNVYQAEPQLGLPLEDILPLEGAALWHKLFERVMRDGSFTLDYVFASPERHFAFSLNPLERDGKVFGISVFGKDITRLKQAEEERQRIELQLWQSQKMESLGSLAGGIAHDFNNMLGGIIGYADLLLSSEEEPKRQNYLKAILGAAERSSEMTRKLLAFGRRGKNVVEPVELDTLVREGLEMLKPSLKQGVDVLLELQAAPRIDADPSQINQVFLNLVINANEAMAGRGVITIRTRAERLDGNAAEMLGVSPGQYVAFSVSDTGIGMNEEVRRRIFEPFFTTKTDGKVLGSGLGLSTVYGIVQSHHGGIQVESIPDQGSTFTAYFPKGKLGDAEGAVKATMSRGRGLVLVVEDEPVMMKFTQAALRELGYTSISAWDGEEGARVFRERHGEISAVILDLKMPKMGGRECFGELQRTDPQVSVLICTGYGENEEVQELISRGARGLLKKPFRVAELAEHLKRMVPSE